MIASLPTAPIRFQVSPNAFRSLVKVASTATSPSPDADADAVNTFLYQPDLLAEHTCQPDDVSLIPRAAERPHAKGFEYMRLSDQVEA